MDQDKQLIVFIFMILIIILAVCGLYRRYNNNNWRDLVDYGDDIIYLGRTLHSKFIMIFYWFNLTGFARLI